MFNEDERRLDWLEAQHTLHTAVEMLYVVDGYQVSVTHDGTPLYTVKGDTLRKAIDSAMGLPGADGRIWLFDDSMG